MILLLLLLQAVVTPCSINPDESCVTFTMVIDGNTRSFTKVDLGIEPKLISEAAYCQANLNKGSLRYFANGTAPSSLVGTLLPTVDMSDSTGTLEDGNAIVLYNRDLIVSFKATQANWGGAELVWECKL